MPKKGQYTKSEYFIWDQMVPGTRWNLRVYCRGCKLHLSGLPQDPQPYTPPVEHITRYCQSASSLPEIADLYRETPETLAFLDGIDNVPTDEKDEAEQWMMDTVACPMPGPSHEPYAVWSWVK